MDKKGLTAVYAIGHFVVDFACALLLFRVLRGTAVWTDAALYYNFCAFALQMPLGLLADRYGRSERFAALGAALVALACLLPGPPVLLSVAAGLGNACYHVGGGVAVLNAYAHQAGPLGVFVSPGALGIFFGTLLGKGGGLPLFVPALTLLVLAALLPLCCRAEKNTPPDLTPQRGAAGWAVVGCLFLVVCLRSYLGFLFAFPWRTGVWALLLSCGVALGKTAGGFLSDWLGSRRASALSLGLAAILFLCSHVPVCGVLAVFLFNMSMPVTLRGAADLFPGAKGFSFGLLTFALFLGFVPAWLGYAGFGTALVYALGAVGSLMLLLPGLGRGRE